jgi:hypothetical protein
VTAGLHSRILHPPTDFSGLTWSKLHADEEPASGLECSAQERLGFCVIVEVRDVQDNRPVDGDRESGCVDPGLHLSKYDGVSSPSGETP